MPDNHAPDELRIFGAFLAAQGRTNDPGTYSKRQPPEPDILFLDDAEGPRAFELVRIIEENWARAKAESPRLQSIVESTYQSLPPSTKSEFAKKYEDAVVNIHFLSTTSRNVRNNRIKALLTRLAELPARTEGGVLHGDPQFRDVIDRVYLDYPPSFKGPHFTLAIGAYVSDATQNLIKRKIENFSSYATDVPIELLAHTDMHPQRFSMERSGPSVASYLETVRHVPYFRIWIFDTETNQVFLVY